MTEIARFVFGAGVVVVSVLYLAVPLIIATALVSISRSLRAINESGVALRYEDATARTSTAPKVRS